MLSIIKLSRFYNSGWDDMVFRNRNQDYGAYQLRKDYPRHLRDAFLITTLGLSILLTCPLWMNIIAKETPHAVPLCDFTLEPAPITDIKERIPEPIPKVALPVMPDLTSVKFIKPKIVANTEAPLDLNLPAFKDLEKGVIGNINKNGNNDSDNAPPADFTIENLAKGDLTQPVEVIEKEKEPAIDEFFTGEKMPEAVNLDELKRKIHFPEILKDSYSNVNSKVIVKLLVDKHGKVMKHKFLKSTHPLFNHEIEKHIYQLQFTPALQSNKAVMAWVVMPFQFCLKNKD